MLDSEGCSGDWEFPCAGAAAAQEGAREAVVEGLSRVIASMPKEAAEAAAAAALDLTRPPLQRLQQLLAGALQLACRPLLTRRLLLAGPSATWAGSCLVSASYALQGNGRLRQATLLRLRCTS